MFKVVSVESEFLLVALALGGAESQLSHCEARINPYADKESSLFSPRDKW
jgi:hypothetical protein